MPCITSSHGETQQHLDISNSKSHRTTTHETIFICDSNFQIKQLTKMHCYNSVIKLFTYRYIHLDINMCKKDQINEKYVTDLNKVGSNNPFSVEYAKSIISLHLY